MINDSRGTVLPTLLNTLLTKKLPGNNVLLKNDADSFRTRREELRKKRDVKTEQRARIMGME